MLNNNRKQIVKTLLERYDKSILSLKENKRTIQIFINVNDETFPKLIHPDSPEEADAIEYDFKELEKLGIIETYKKDDLILKIILKTDVESIKKARLFAGVADPSVEAKQYQLFFQNYLKDDDETIKAFSIAMYDRLSDHRKLDSVKKYFGDQSTLVKIIKGIKQINLLQEEIRERNLSISLYSDSKMLGLISPKMNKILREFSSFDFDDELEPLEQLGIVHNPSFALIKNGVKLKLRGQELDLSLLDYPMPLFDQAIKDLEIEEVKSTKLITIENLTTFYDCDDKENVIIYLGGFHNKIRKTLITKIYKAKPSLQCFHWSDIDSGGFYIFNHLVKDTQIFFNPLSMGINELSKYKNQCKQLTQNDIHRLRLQRQNLEFSEFWPVIDYMIKNNVKLEQEAFSLSH
jgi:hypothetical protein